jgi:hypothetical protein
LSAQKSLKRVIRVLLTLARARDLRSLQEVKGMCIGLDQPCCLLVFRDGKYVATIHLNAIYGLSIWFPKFDVPRRLVCQRGMEEL